MSASRFKVGDSVQVKSLAWYVDNKNSLGKVDVPCCFTRAMSEYCGRVFTIERVNSSYYNLAGVGFMWSDEMFEDTMSGMPRELRYLETKDVRDLPRSYRDCCKVLNIPFKMGLTYKDEEGTTMTLRRYIQDAEEWTRLLVCRDAYWKLANNWVPDYKSKEKKPCIMKRGGKVVIGTTIENSRILTFPTKEMAEAFEKNFHVLISLCAKFL